MDKPWFLPNKSFQLFPWLQNAVIGILLENSVSKILDFSNYQLV